MNNITEQLIFAAKMSLLLSGTSDNETATPGYLYKEICDISNVSSIQSEYLLQFFMGRLKKPSWHIKLKTLKLLNYIIENGPECFRDGLRKDDLCLQEAVKFGGLADPIHGLVPYQAVRQCAQELIAKLFHTIPVAEAGNCPVVSLEKIDVFSGKRSELDPNSKAAIRLRLDNFIKIYYDILCRKHQDQVGIGPMNCQNGRYYGFGNTPEVKKSLVECVRIGLEKMSAKLSDTPAQRTLSSLVAEMQRERREDCCFDYDPVLLPLHTGVGEPSEHPIVKAIPKHIPGRAGGGWDEDESEAPSMRDSPYGASLDRISDDKSEQCGSEIAMPAEECLVMSYLLPDDCSQCLLLQPSQLNSFKDRCHCVNCKKIIEILNREMSSHEAHIVIRAMLLLETFLFHSDAVSVDFIAERCRIRLDHLAQCHGDTRVRHKAEKITKILHCLLCQESRTLLTSFRDNLDY